MSERFNYGNRRWRRRREQFLRAHPLCERCERRGVIRIATEVHHRKQHHGDPALIWCGDEGLEGLCSNCHNQHAQAEEKSGRIVGHDIDGYPLDPAHPWSRARAKR